MREYAQWDEYFEYKENKRGKLDHYLANLLYIFRNRYYEESFEIGECYFPPVPPEEIEAAKKQLEDEQTVDADTAARILKKAFK